MPTASCAGVQISVGLPATAGGAVTTAFTSGAVLSTTAGVVIVSTLPALSVTTAEMVTAPSGGCPLPVAVFHARAKPPAATVTAAPMLCAPPVVPVQRHCTLRMPEVPSTASVVSATAAPVTAVPAAGVDDGAEREGCCRRRPWSWRSPCARRCRSRRCRCHTCRRRSWSYPGGGDRTGCAVADGPDVQDAREDARSGVRAGAADGHHPAQEVRRAQRRHGNRARGRQRVDRHLNGVAVRPETGVVLRRRNRRRPSPGASVVDDAVGGAPDGRRSRLAPAIGGGTRPAA